MQCIGYFHVIFAVLGVRWPGVALGALRVIHCATRSHECLADIAAAELLGRLLPLLHTLPDALSLTLDTLYTLMSSPKLVKEAALKGDFNLKNNVFVVIFPVIYYLLSFRIQIVPCAVTPFRYICF